MKAKEEEGKAVSVWLDAKTLEEIQRLADKAELTRSKFLGNIIKVGVEELAACDKVGVFQMGVLLRNMQEALKGWAQTIKERSDDCGEVR